MPASLVPDALLSPDGLIAARDRELAAVFDGWPLGHPDARLVQEYLAGRAAGALDISGRPTGTDGTGPTGATIAEASGGDAPLPLSIVLDDPDGALALAVAHSDSGPVLAFADSIAAEAAARRSVDAVAAVSDRVRSAAPLQSTAVAERDGPAAAGDGEPGAGGGEPDAQDSGTAASGAGAPAEPAEHPGLQALAVAARSASEPCRVILSAPKAVRVLTEYLEVLAPAAEEFLVVGRDKHMSRGLNAELAKFYDRVDVSPGRAKSRLLIASRPRSAASQGTASHAPVPGASDRIPAPRTAAVSTRVPGIPDIRVSAFGACFGGPTSDPGSELLLDAVRSHLGPAAPATDLPEADGSPPAAAEPVPTDADQPVAPRRILDLGCGNGWLLAALGALHPGAALTGVDVSRAAIASATVTCAAGTPDGNGSRARAADPHHSQPTCPRLLLQDATAPLPWGAGAEAVAAGMFDLVVLNPPFHDGTTIETGTARTLIHRAHELLAPGGRLVCVFNSHLRYRPIVDRVFGTSVQWARDRRFTVVSAAVPA
ncbi:methyltransferase [Nocardia zapadnayensis]|uniref:methyltransferase n=1 Tax=Brevibacterium sp. R8603A2 TaxID=2929779 RepID=UPI001FFBC1F7|nr:MULTISPECIES: methyltransferase [Actinomycetes]MCK1803220.1 methyltransferase [Brevibacterium sp. R8603A2]MCX0277091.1 methyltransferase [Nocardia zapadnayensis]